MNAMPNHEFLELHQIHQNPHCKQQCFVFTEIPDIDLPEITKFNPEKLKNGSIHSYSNKSKIETISPPPSKAKNKRIVAIVSGLMLLLVLAAGIPIGLQLRSSSLLEKRLSFVRRLLTEYPLVDGYWMPELDTNFTQSYEEAKEGMVGALLWPISVACGAQYLDAVQLALEGIDEARRLVDRNFGLRIIENSEQMEQAHNDGMVSVLLGLTGGHALGSSLAVLRMMYSLGARFVSLTALGCATPWADASVKNEIMLEDDITYSLTNFGEVIIHEMNRIGMMVDISRLSEPAMMLALSTTKAPMLLSNVLPKSFCNSTLTATVPDHILSIISQNGGVLMLNVERCGDKLLSVKEAIASINYVRVMAGVDHVGLSGSPKNYPLLLAELARDRLWGNVAIKKLVGGNILRVLRDVEINKNSMPLSEDWIPTESIEGNSYCRYPET